jgi:hypothetical protein
MSLAQPLQQPSATRWRTWAGSAAGLTLELDQVLPA